MTTVISILILLVSVLLILVVLVQNPKGGGLATGFSGGNQVMGARRTTDFLEKATWGLAGLLMLMSIVSTSLTVSNSDAPQDEEANSKTIDKAGELDAKSKQPGTKPVTPAPAPGQQPPAPGQQPPAPAPAPGQ
ncbi:MAG: preprotein translocase subunit SecG [Bacteroidia bacterium]|jgi:preprotein translocase subunit SecG|nr:preprotein translocase subunit SecG [Bacteroidia bacterium]